MRRPFGGEEGIRTFGALAGTTAYQAAALSHSATSGQVLPGEAPLQKWLTGFGLYTAFRASKNRVNPRFQVRPLVLFYIFIRRKAYSWIFA
jgi:hypothetical protein